MHYFHNLSSASGDFAPDSHHPWTPLGNFRPQALNLPTPEKNHAGTHDAKPSPGSIYESEASRDRVSSRERQRWRWRNLPGGMARWGLY